MANRLPLTTRGRRRDPSTLGPFELPVTSGIVALAVLVTLLEWFGKDVSRLFLTDYAFFKEPWRLFTCALVHADIRQGIVGAAHVLFNSMWMLQLGKLIEARYGASRTLLLYLGLTAGSMAAQFAFDRGGVGLSGVVYGVFGFLWIAEKRSKDFEGVINFRMTASFVGWFFFCIAATHFNALTIANVAHGVGGLIGVLVGAAATAKKSSGRGVFGGLAAASIVVSIVLAAEFRGTVSFVPDDVFVEAMRRAPQSPVRAERSLSQLIRRQPDKIPYLIGLADVEHVLGKDESAARHQRHACALLTGQPEATCELPRFERPDSEE